MMFSSGCVILYMPQIRPRKNIARKDEWSNKQYLIIDILTTFFIAVNKSFVLQKQLTDCYYHQSRRYTKRQRVAGFLAKACNRRSKDWSHQNTYEASTIHSSIKQWEELGHGFLLIWHHKLFTSKRSYTRFYSSCSDPNQCQPNKWQRPETIN